MRSLLSAALLVAMAAVVPADRPTMELRSDVEIPELSAFAPLPPSAPDFSEKLRVLVEAAGLDEVATAEASPNNNDQVASIALVDLRDPSNPVVADWNGDAFVYPASTYKMYVAAEAIRRVVAGDMSLDDTHEITPHNVRGTSGPAAGAPMSLSEIIRLTMQYSDNTTANELIDIVDRHKASALMHALGCHGSEITRKFLPRNLEDEGYEDIMGTVTSGRHLAKFLWGVEQGAIGGGKGRGLIKGYLAMNDRGRFYRGLPESATIHSKTGWWNIYTSEAAIIEDGDIRYILCVLSVQNTSVADERMAKLAAGVHAMLAE